MSQTYLPIIQDELEPINKNRSHSFDCIIYQLGNEIHKTNESWLVDKLNNLIINDEQNNKDEEFKNSIQKCLGINKMNRYFQSNRLIYCTNCKQNGHQYKQCIQELNECCQYCLSSQHLFYQCKQQACYKCHMKGHKKQNCKNQKTYPYCPLLGSENIPIHLATCYICFEIGHVNCNNNKFNDHNYSYINY